ncbi:hypothetical protein LUZ60_011761 [Juncus effusus]|nr:hypothetical protein LUZ60_011761 [Juncus effusus]
MAVSIEREEWELPSLPFYCIFASCFCALFFLPFFSKRTPAASLSSSSSSDHLQFSRFQKKFLLIYSLATVIGGLQSVYGEDEFVQFGLNRDRIALLFSFGAFISLVFGTFSGIFSDLIGSRRACMIYFILHILANLFKIMNWIPFLWIKIAFFAISSSFFSFCFETCMVFEHEKQGHKKDLLMETFWQMTFFESISLIGSQVITNSLISDNLDKGPIYPSSFGAFLALLLFLYIKRKWKNDQNITSPFWSYRKSFSSHVLSDERIWALNWAQASIHFSSSIFLFLWAPTIVADGRDVNLSKIFPLFIGSRMIGSTLFPYFNATSSFYYNENSLTCAFISAGLSLSIVAYDYQEIGTLVFLFCIFHACVGFILPSLASLRTQYLPNELRGGMISVSHAPSNAAIILILLMGGYRKILLNSVIMGLAAFGLLTAGGFIYLLKRSKKSHQNWHAL